MTGWRPGAVALDIDGTLFSAPHGSSVVDETMSPRLARAIDRVVELDVPVVLATGRSTFGVTPVLETLRLQRRSGQVLAVASNGSVTFSYPPVEVIDTGTNAVLGYFTKPGSGPMAVGPDGIVYFTDPATGRIHAVTVGTTPVV